MPQSQSWTTLHQPLSMTWGLQGQKTTSMGSGQWSIGQDRYQSSLSPMTFQYKNNPPMPFSFQISLQTPFSPQDQDQGQRPSGLLSSGQGQDPRPSASFSGSSKGEPVFCNYYLLCGLFSSFSAHGKINKTSKWGVSENSICFWFTSNSYWLIRFQSEWALLIGCWSSTCKNAQHLLKIFIFSFLYAGKGQNIRLRH